MKYVSFEISRYWDPVAMTYQQERMPEHIKLKVGGATEQQSAVYEEFARNVPGFKPLTERELLSIMPKSTPQFMDANAANNPAAAAVMSSAAPGSGAPPGSTAAGTTTTSQPQPQQQPQQPSWPIAHV